MRTSSIRHFTTLLPGSPVDVGTLSLALIPSSTDTGPITEPTTTEALILVPFATEGLGHVDSGTEAFKLVASGVDISVFVDSGTEPFKLTASGVDDLCLGKVEFEGDLESRWSAFQHSRWSALGESRWNAQFLGVGEGFAC